MRSSISLILLAASLAAAPPDFGQQELRTASSARGVLINLTTEVSTDQPETFHITAVDATTARISGGDLRGLMYGLIEASEQVRASGAVLDVATEPGMRLRSMRLSPSDTDLAVPRFYSTDRWMAFFQMLARNRVNRFTLVLPPERWEGDRIRLLSTLAHDYAVDFFIGVRTASGNRALGLQLRKMLDECVLVRGVQVDVGRDTVEYFRTVIFPAIKDTGRRVTLDLRGTEARPDVLRAAQTAAIALEVASRTSAAALGRAFYAIVPAGSVATEIESVRARLAVVAAAGATGFEVDLSGPNFDGYERTYWAWGRQGYDFRSPTLSPVKGSSRR